MTNLEKEIAAKRAMDAYVSELESFLSRNINKELLKVGKDVEEIRNNASSLVDENKKSFLIDFKEKQNERFRQYISNLEDANSSEIYVWTERSNLCNPYRIDSLKRINFTFPFNVNPEGIVVFLTTDFRDKLLFDFFRDKDDREMLEIEAQGKHWSPVEY